jgi:hypothetical protein
MMFEPRISEKTIDDRLLDRVFSYWGKTGRPAGSKLPPHLENTLSYLDWSHTLDHATITTDKVSQTTINAIRTEIENALPAYNERRYSERKLADYIEDVFHANPSRYDLQQLVESLRTCRACGTVGVSFEGTKRIAWQCKCHKVRLCPDESREETQRLCKKYIPAMQQWVKEGPNRRLFYAVLTMPNAAPGQLLSAKKFIFDDFNRKILKGREYIPESERVGRKRYRELFPNIKGAFVVQEDPLSKHNDWNVHLNVVLAVEGEFDYSKLREHWGYNVHITRIKPSVEGLTRALLEIVKYSAQIVPTKSEEKASRNKSKAPAMIEWDPVLWLEWWAAQTNFRRTRSYGCFYKVESEDNIESFQEVIWLGKIVFNEHSLAYSVDLILGDNFSVSPASGASKKANSVPRTGFNPYLHHP